MWRMHVYVCFAQNFMMLLMSRRLKRMMFVLERRFNDLRIVKCPPLKPRKGCHAVEYFSSGTLVLLRSQCTSIQNAVLNCYLDLYGLSYLQFVPSCNESWTVIRTASCSYVA